MNTDKLFKKWHYFNRIQREERPWSINELKPTKEEAGLDFPLLHSFRRILRKFFTEDAKNYNYNLHVNDHDYKKQTDGDFNFLKGA